MDSKTLDKITKALNTIITAVEAIQEDVKAQHDIDPETDIAAEDPEKAAEIQGEVVTEVRTAIETLIEDDEYSTEEIAVALTTLSQALQDIDPDVFDTETEEDDEDEKDEDEDSDIDLDDLDEDEDDEEEEEDEEDE